MLFLVIGLFVAFVQQSNAFTLTQTSNFGVPRSSSNTNMSIAVFGASGLLGSEAVYQALERGEKVVAFARDPSKIRVPMGSGGERAGQPITSDNLTTVQGTVLNAEDVSKAFAGDVKGVIVALGGKTAQVGEHMLRDGTTNIINAMKEKGVKRIAVVTSIGVGDSSGQAPFFFKILMGTVMRKIFNDKNDQEALFAPGGIGNDLEYTIVRPGGLTVEPPTGVINVIKGEAGSIPRADVASFCLSAVLDPGFEYLKQAPCLSSTGGTSWSKDRSAASRGEM